MGMSFHGGFQYFLEVPKITVSIYPHFPSPFSSHCVANITIHFIKFVSIVLPLVTQFSGMHAKSKILIHSSETVLSVQQTWPDYKYVNCHLCLFIYNHIKPTHLSVNKIYLIILHLFLWIVRQDVNPSLWWEWFNCMQIVCTYFLNFRSNWNRYCLTKSI